MRDISGTELAKFQGYQRDNKITKASVTAGETLFGQYGCSACHSIDRVTIKPDGFKVSFTREIPDQLKDVKAWNVSSFTYQSKWTYGSDPEDKKEHQASIAASDARSATLRIDGLAKHRVYRIAIPKHNSPDGSPLQNILAFYTVNAVPKK